MKVLANDGISESGILALQKGGYEVITTKVAQEQVANFVKRKQRKRGFGKKCHQSSQRYY